MTEATERYLRHAISPETPQATHVDLTMHGHIRTSPAGKWMPFRATETLTWPGGFVWRASAGGLVRIIGEDRYLDGAGAMRWKLWGLVPVVSASGPDITRSARGRFAMEAAAWLPAILRDARWEDTGPVLTVDGERFPLHFDLGPDGALRQVTLERWGNAGTPRGRYEQIPFGVRCSGESTFGGYSVPTRLSGGWRPNSDAYFEFIRMDVDAASYT